MSRLLAALVLALLLAPLAEAAAPAPMHLSGRVVVNGRHAEEGTLLSVVAQGRVVARVPVGPEGAFDAAVPGDDPDTPAREGAAPGDPLSFELLGGRVGSDASFSAGQRRSVAVSLLLPDVAVLSAEAIPAEVDEGNATRVRASVANRGNATALDVRVSVGEGGATLGGRFLADLPAGALVPVEIVVPTGGMGGNRTLLVQAAASNGDARADAPALAPLRVRSDEPPAVLRAAQEPAAPVEGAPVFLVVEASDPSGVAWVRFHWEVAGRASTVNRTEAPFRVLAGPFGANETVRWWAVAADAGPLNRTTTTPTQAFEVRASPAAATPASPEDAPPAPTTPEAPEDGGGGRVPGAPLALLAGAAWLAAQLRRRRT